MLTVNAIYRFNRTKHLHYYQARRTPGGLEYLTPVSIDGADVVKRHSSGRTYVILYFVLSDGQLASSGYWLGSRQPFENIYITDATTADLEFIAEEIAALPDADRRLDDIFNRHEVQVDLDIWGEVLG